MSDGWRTITPTMNLKYVLGGGIAAGIVMFLWSAIAHMAIPIPEPLTQFKNNQAVMDVIRAQTNGNGVYFDPRGIFAAVRLTPDMADMSQSMGPYLATEAASNILQGIVLAVLLAAVRPRTVTGYGIYALIIGLFTWLAVEVSLWNWYGFSGRLILYDVIDVPIASALAGLLLGWMLSRSQSSTRSAAA